MLEFFKVCAFFFAFYSAVKCETKPVAMGNVQTVINSAKLYSEEPSKNYSATALWCEVKKDKNAEDIRAAKFVRHHDKFEFPADIDSANRAYLNFPKEASASASGKYRCEITLLDGQTIVGNMFAYHSAIINNTNRWPVTKSEDDPVLIYAPAITAPLESDAEIECPFGGYPVPSVTWYKDNYPIEFGEKFHWDKETHVLKIKNVNVTDAGEYRCELKNMFPLVYEGPEQTYEAKLARRLEVGSNLGWILPLIVILIILLLLFIIIFVCQRCQKYKSADYNVEARERGLHNDTTPLKNSV